MDLSTGFCVFDHQVEIEACLTPTVLYSPCQPVQGFDYAKKHLGRTGDEAISVTKDTLVLGLPVRDAPLSLSLDKKVLQDGSSNKRPPSADIHNGG